MTQAQAQVRQIEDADGTKLFDTRVHYRDKKTGKIDEKKSRPYRRICWKNPEGDRFAVNAVEGADGKFAYFDDAGNACDKPEVPVTMPKKGAPGLPEGVQHTPQGAQQVRTAPGR